jgi:hypothetical protein
MAVLGKPLFDLGNSPTASLARAVSLQTGFLDRRMGIRKIGEFLE